VTDNLSTQLDRTHLPEETRADAISYLTRSGNADVLEALGLVADPIAAERSRAKALAGLNAKAPASRPAADRPGYCVHCNNKLPGHGVCRRGKRCREDAS
jgi:hypothetical protein